MEENMNEYEKKVSRSFMDNKELTPHELALKAINTIDTNREEAELMIAVLAKRVKYYMKNSDMLYEWHGESLKKIMSMKKAKA